MSDSGLIDLFAIHKEEEQRQSMAPPAPSAPPSAAYSAPPPAVAVDLSSASLYGGVDEEVDGYAAAQSKAKRRGKLLGGVIGGMAVVGVIIAGITIGGANEKSKPTDSPSALAAQAAAAADPPPAAPAVPPPAAVEPPPPANLPAPPATAKSKSEKPDYTPATAAAAYATQQKGKKSGGSARPSGRAIGGASVKMTKVQSAGVQ